MCWREGSDEVSNPGHSAAVNRIKVEVITVGSPFILIAYNSENSQIFQKVSFYLTIFKLFCTIEPLRTVLRFKQRWYEWHLHNQTHLVSSLKVFKLKVYKE